MMSHDGHTFDDVEAFAVEGLGPFTGSMGKTRLETVHWSSGTGALVSVRVHTVVNAITDPALAERLLTGNLNWLQPPGSEEMERVLVPGGRIYVLEFTTPQNPFVRRCYGRYLVRVLPKIAGWISGDVDSYRYLAETILEFPTPEAFRQEMIDSGLAAARSYPMTRGVAWLHVAEKPCPPGMNCNGFLNQMAPGGSCTINPRTWVRNHRR